MRTRAGLKRLLRTALAAGLIAVRPVSAGTADNGTFRFLTLSLPDGSTNAEYVARLLTANADGPVVFTITGLAPGMDYDPASGFITGRPTVVGNYHVDITATDGINTITQNNVPLKVNAAGGGGNAGATFNVNSLPDATAPPGRRPAGRRAGYCGWSATGPRRRLRRRRCRGCHPGPMHPPRQWPPNPTARP